MTIGEFGVHATDIADACGWPEQIHPKSATIVVGILDGLLGCKVPSTIGWTTTAYVVAGTGRHELTSEDSVKLRGLAGKFPLLR